MRCTVEIAAQQLIWNERKHMKDNSGLSPDERKRVSTELRKDKDYVENRRTLVVVSLIGAVFLLFVAWMLMNDIVSMWVAAAEIFLFVVFYQFYIFRFARIQKQIQDRLENMRNMKARNTKGKSAKLKR